MLLIVTILVILSGCIYDDKQPKNNIVEDEKYITVKYIDKGNIINPEDFPDFKLIYNIYYVTPENISLTLQTEMGHGTLAINGSNDVPQGYRIYGSSEIYNSSERYLLLQYKVFDNDEDLNGSIDVTVDDYVQNGFELKSYNNSYNNSYKGKISILESNVTNSTDMNVVIILFGFDTAIGKIGVRDHKDLSLNESLKILDMVSDGLKINTKDVKSEKMNTSRLSSVKGRDEN